VRWQFPCLRRDDGINPADVVNADQKKRNQNDEADLPRLLQHLDKWRSPNYLHSRTGIGPPRVRRMLQPLIDCGDVLQRERTKGRPEYILHRHSDFTETMTDGVTNENARRPPDNEPD
jgi:hypothetical protein